MCKKNSLAYRMLESQNNLWGQICVIKSLWPLTITLLHSFIEVTCLIILNITSSTLYCIVYSLFCNCVICLGSSLPYHFFVQALCFLFWDLQYLLNIFQVDTTTVSWHCLDSVLVWHYLIDFFNHQNLPKLKDGVNTNFLEIDSLTRW